MSLSWASIRRSAGWWSSIILLHPTFNLKVIDLASVQVVVCVGGEGRGG